MVCTFMLIVLPAMLLRTLYSVFCWLTGRKQEQPKPAEKTDAPAKTGTCPYHVVMNFLGFKIPEKKQAPVAAAEAQKVDEVEQDKAKAE